MNNKKKTHRMIFLTIVFVLFIFWNSLQPGKVSSGYSSGVTDMINSVLHVLNPKLQVSTFMVRKAAHFSEYFVLGLMMMNVLGLSEVKVSKGIIYPLFFGLLIPVLDETIQLFVPNRSGEVRDVLIDFSGVLTAIGLFLLIQYLFNKWKVSAGANKNIES